MRPVCLLNRTKNLRQSDGLHFISDSLKENPRMFRADFRIDAEISSSPYIVQAVQQYFDRRR